MSGYMQSDAEKDKLRKEAQQMSREDLEVAYVEMCARYWETYEIAEELLEWAGLDYEEEIRLAERRIEDMRRADKALDVFANFFGRVKKYSD